MDGEMYFDSTKINEMISNVDAAKIVLVNNENNIYNDIDKMNEGWSGDGYDSYKQNANNYRGALDSVNVFFEAYSAMLSEVEEEFNKQLKALNDALNLE